MKKAILILAAAVAALTACSKSELAVSGTEGERELTFQAAPLTKTPTTTQKEEFDNTNVFASAAYYIDEKDANGDIIDFADWDWTSTTNPEPDLFIGTENATIGAINGDVIAWDTTDKVWRSTSRKYYWPKKGQLTFFAWSLNKADLNFPSGSTTWISCTAKQGVVAMYYDIVKNKNIDFMVADIAADKSANENVYYRTGVPTLFRHKLSQLKLTVKEKDTYQGQGVYFTLKGITFNNLNKDANYTQEPDKMTVGTTKSNQSYTSADQKVDKTTETDITSVDQYIYLPQSLDDANKTITITYTIGYDLDGDGTVDESKGDIVETIIVTKKLSEIFGTEWAMGKKYTLDLTFALDEILWDPAVQDWIDETGAEVPVK